MIETADLLRSAYLALEQGEPARAEQILLNAVASFPGRADYWCRLGMLRLELGKANLAVRALKHAVTLDGRDPEGYFPLAAAYVAAGRLHDALQVSLKAVELAPGLARSHANLATVLEALGRPEEALAAYERALFISPDTLNARHNSGLLLVSEGRYAEAVQNNQVYVADYPERFEAWFNLGDALLRLENYASAAHAFFKAAQLQPENAKPLLHGAFAHALLGEFDLAQQGISQAMDVDPEGFSGYCRSIAGVNKLGGDVLDARMLYVLHHVDKLKCCEWAERSHFLRNLQCFLDAENFATADFSLGFISRTLGLSGSLQRKVAATIASRFAVNNQRAASDLIYPAEKTIRVGYLSSDFRQHATSYFAYKLFGLHDRARFRVYAYAIGPDDKGPIRNVIRESVDAFCDLSSMNDDDAANRIVQDRIDILIDLGGYTDYCRPGIFARRAAAVQVSWLAYIATTGAPWMDYAIVDPVVVPPALEGDWTESIVRMPDSLYFCSFPDVSLSPVQRSDHGLPEHALVLAAFHVGLKIDPEIFGIWMGVLRDIPDAVLWLFDKGPEMKGNLAREAERHGVSPSRLIFAPSLEQTAHLERLSCADLFLDAILCNGATTVAEAVVAGVPVVTCIGEVFHQRVAASILHAAGFSQGVTQSANDYQSLALRWVGDRDELARQRQLLRDARGSAPFYDRQRWVRDFEVLLQEVYTTHRYRLSLKESADEISH